MSATKTAAVAWRPRAFWGLGGATINASGVLALSNSALASSRARTYVLTASSGQYCWYCYPATWGAGTDTIGGLNGGINAPVTLSVTNALGVTVSYYAYRTVNDALGVGVNPQTFVWS